MIRTVLGWLAPSIAIVACVGGCSGPTSTVDTVPVTGNVTFKGQPVAGAVVSFSPKSDGTRAAFGQTDASGKFSLTTVNPGDGAMAGSYTVTVSKTTASAGAGGGGGDYNMDDEASVDAAYAEYEASKKAGGEKQEPQDLLPVKYKDASTSDLEAEVTSAGGDFTFDLKE